MIKQLQRRFIRIAVVALTVAMVLVVGIVNIANWISVKAKPRPRDPRDGLFRIGTGISGTWYRKPTGLPVS